MARLSSPESVMTKLANVHEKIDELFETVEQVKEIRGRVHEIYDELKQKNISPDQAYKGASQSPDIEKEEAEAKTPETSLSDDFASLFSNESQRLENEIDVRIENVSAELKTSFSDKKRAMNELIASLQHQVDELNRMYEASGQDVLQNVDSLKNEFQARFEQLESAIKDDRSIVKLEKQFQDRFEELKTAAEDDPKISELENAFQLRLNELDSKLEAAEQNALKIEHQTGSKLAGLAGKNKQFQKDLLQKIANSLAEKIKRMENDIHAIARQTFTSLTARETDSKQQYDEQLGRLAKQVNDCTGSLEKFRIQKDQRHEALKQVLLKLTERQNKLINALNSQDKRLSAIEARLNRQKKSTP